MDSPLKPQHIQDASIVAAWYRPMLIASLALHGLVLVAPTPVDPQSVLEEEAEEEVIDLADLAVLPSLSPSLSPLSSPLPLPLAESTPVPAPVPAPVSTPAIVSNSIPQPIPVSVPDPVPQSVSTPTPSQVATPTLPPTPLPTPIATPIPTFAPQGLTPEQLQAYQAVFDQINAQEAAIPGAVGRTAIASQQMATEIDCSFFDQPDAFFVNCGTDGTEAQRRSEIFRVDVRPQTKPDAALEFYAQTFSNNQFNETGRQYGGAPLYEVTSETAPPMYMSLVGWGIGNSTTIAVFWWSDPTSSSVSNSVVNP